jgi:hypothetical protein
MNARDLEILNARNRMTPEERDLDILRETFGPLFSRVFPDIAPPKVNNDEQEKQA